MESIERQRLTMALIKQCAVLDYEKASSDEIADKLLDLTILRLDWQKLEKLENLDAFTKVKELYLQHNYIERIENLDFHYDLEFLALSNNRIKEVTNIAHLRSLKFLDLSQNHIETVSAEQFPASLIILRLAGNPCATNVKLKEELFQSLPNLTQIDDERFNGQISTITEPQATIDSNNESIQVSDELIAELKQKKQDLLQSSATKLDLESKEILNQALDTLADRKAKMLRKIRDRTNEEINNSKERFQKHLHNK